MDMRNLPAQPTEEDWQFVQELQSPLWERHNWVKREVRDGEVAFADGVRIIKGADDREGLLVTAYEDLRNFLRAGRVPLDGPFVIETGDIDRDVPEAYRVEVSSDGCRILAGDTEGVRRGIFYVEDEVLRAEGPVRRWRVPAFPAQVPGPGAQRASQALLSVLSDGSGSARRVQAGHRRG